MGFCLLIFFYNRILNESSDSSIVSKQDEITIIRDVARNQNGRTLAFDYLDQNWDRFYDR